MVWGRRRVGKTALLQRFAEGRPTVFHTASGRPAHEELALLSRAAAPALRGRVRDPAERSFTDWADALEALADAARDAPLLLVLDEFPELASATPHLPGILRASWDRLRSQTQLRILLCGSAVRVMEAMQRERAPLYGRLDLSLTLHPFRPYEAAAMLPRLAPAERATVWGILGGMPLYLEWWDQSASVRDNLARLACRPGGLLLTEGELVLATEGDTGGLARRVLFAIAAGRTKYHEIEASVGADPARVLERLVGLRLVERLVPVSEDPRRTRRRTYRIADNLLAFWLGLLDRHRAEIERGLGAGILQALMGGLDDHLGGPWEEAFRAHLRRLAERGELGDEVVAVGPFWTAEADPGEIDAVALAGRRRTAVLVGEAKWARRIDAPRVRHALERTAEALPQRAAELRFAVCAREVVHDPDGVLAITAADIFDG